MWRLNVVIYNPVVDFEDVIILECNTDIEAWDLHERLFRCNNVLSISKPIKQSI